MKSLYSTCTYYSTNKIDALSPTRSRSQRMTSVKFRNMGNCPYEQAPPLGYEYDLFFIKSNELAECLGSESTGEYYLVKEEDIVASNKFEWKEEPSHDPNQYSLLQVVHIGKLVVTKVHKWKNHYYSYATNYQYSIVGDFKLFDKPIVDSALVTIINDKVKGLIDKYHWKIVS